MLGQRWRVGLEDKAGFYLDGNYHSLFTIKRWPQKTYPGIVHRLTALPFLDYQITVNLEPIPVRDEITREEKAIDRLRGDYEEEGKYSMSVALKKKERKIDSLAQGFSFPFYVEYFIRVWDRSESGLNAKCAAIKNAVNQMNGAQVYETALPTTAKKLFLFHLARLDRQQLPAPGSLRGGPLLRRSPAVLFHLHGASGRGRGDL